MKLLISAGYFPVVPYADNNIEVSIAKELNALGHQCDIAGITYEIEDELTYINDVKIHKIPYACRALMKARRLSKKSFGNGDSITKSQKISFLLRHPIASYYLKLNGRRKGDPRLLTDYVTEIKRLVETEKYDAIICCVWPFEKTREITLSDEINIPKFYYQLDPEGMSEYQDNHPNVTIPSEVEVMSHSNWIFTSYELMRQYVSLNDYKPVISKMTGVGFPTYKSASVKGKSVIDFQSEHKNLLFCGTVEDEVRNPVPTLALIEKMMRKDETLHLYFLGRFISKKGREFIDTHHLSDRIHIIGEVSPYDAYSTIVEADCLLNIGNQYTNMVPSKIFTYFSSGKPIINMQIIENDPAIPYFRKYPLAFTGMPGEIDPDTLLSFINENKGKRLDQSTVDHLYEDCTPKHVAKVMEEKIKEVIL